MNQHYKDIIDLIEMHEGMDPLWFDENAVPRFCKFHPQEAADIYADEVALCLIKCQGCGHEFHVAMSMSAVAKVRENIPFEVTLRGAIERSIIHYGDPPNIACCDTGPTMNSEMVRVVEYWSRDLSKLRNWERDPQYEITIEE